MLTRLVPDDLDGWFEESQRPAEMKDTPVIWHRASVNIWGSGQIIDEQN